MNQLVRILALALCSATVSAYAQSVQYVSDNIAISMRDAPKNSANVIGAVKSGDRVTVLEKLGEQSFARIRTIDGREGWVTARYLSDQPAAADQLGKLKAELDAAKSQIKSLDGQLQQARAQVEKAQPALKLANDNQRLKQELDQKEQSVAMMAQRYNGEREKRKTLVTGATLVGGGVLGGLILPWLLQIRRRRRWGDF